MKSKVYFPTQRVGNFRSSGNKSQNLPGAQKSAAGRWCFSRDNVKNLHILLGRRFFKFYSFAIHVPPRSMLRNVAVVKFWCRAWKYATSCSMACILKILACDRQIWIGLRVFCTNQYLAPAQSPETSHGLSKFVSLWKQLECISLAIPRKKAFFLHWIPTWFLFCFYSGKSKEWRQGQQEGGMMGGGGGCWEGGGW